MVGPHTLWTRPTFSSWPGLLKANVGVDFSDLYDEEELDLAAEFRDIAIEDMRPYEQCDARGNTGYIEAIIEEFDLQPQ